MIQKSTRKHTQNCSKMAPKKVSGRPQNRAPALPRAPLGHGDLPGTAPGLPGTSFWRPRSSPGHHFVPFWAMPSRVFNEFREQQHQQQQQRNNDTNDNNDNDDNNDNNDNNNNNITITKLWKTISESMLECARPVVAAGVVDPAAHP